MWKKSLDDKVKILPDGDERIICIELEEPQSMLCLICVYLPCRGRASSGELDFQESLDIIREIYTKYWDSHTIILMGDLNASVTKEDPNARDKALLKFCHELSISVEVPKQETFFHVNGRDTNQSDYILLQSTKTNRCKTYLQLGYEELGTNVSDHIPVLMKFSTKVTKHHDNGNGKSSLTQPKVRWDKIDIAKYRTLTEKKTLQTNTKDMSDIFL